LGGLLVFGMLAGLVLSGQPIFLDNSAGTLLHGYSSPALDALMQLATFMGSWMALPVVVAAGLCWLIWRRCRWEARFLIMACGGGVALNELLKLLFQRPRPTLPWSVPTSEYSFPSGHSMDSLVCYVGLAGVVWAVGGRRIGIAAGLAASLLVVAIGASRVYLGYHYLSDVVGGFSAGLVWLIASAGFIASRRSLARRRGRTSGPDQLAPTEQRST